MKKPLKLIELNHCSQVSLSCLLSILRTDLDIDWITEKVLMCHWCRTCAIGTGKTEQDRSHGYNSPKAVAKASH